MPVPTPLCSSNPFIQLGLDSSKAPRLNYKMEQENCLSLFSYIPIPIALTKFTDFAKKVPIGTIAYADMAIDAIESMIIGNMQVNPDAVIAGLQKLAKADTPLIVYKEITSENNAAGRMVMAQASVSKPYFKTKEGKGALVVAAIGGMAKNFVLSSTPIQVNDWEANQKVEMADIPQMAYVGNKVVELSVTSLANALKNGYVPTAVKTANGDIAVSYFKTPATPNPTMFLKYEMQLCSFLGNYGAGKTVKTFSLLPGEKTTISVRTYKESTIQKNKAENILDSMSEASADSFETSLQSNSNESLDISKTTTATMGVTANIGVSLPIKIASLSLGFGASASLGVSAAVASSNLQQTVSSAIANHVNESNKHREVNVNTSTYESTTEIEESTITRELENINVNRSLNYVFRQLNQEMHSVLWLKNIKFCFTNGIPGSYEETYSVGLDDFLAKHVLPLEKQSVLEAKPDSVL
jgi:hypothetical protein